MSAPSKALRVGVILFEGFELLDVFGPLEILGGKSEISMLAERPGPVASIQGPRSVVDRTLADAGGYDVVLVPGGWGTRREANNEALLAALRRLSESSQYVCSVCTGAALLARAGILDGRRATTNKAAYAWVVSQGPGVRWVPKARWVEDGKFFTSSGVSAGMDMSLGLVSHLFGRQEGVAAARSAEYEWHEDRDWDPFAALNGLA